MLLYVMIYIIMAVWYNMIQSIVWVGRGRRRPVQVSIIHAMRIMHQCLYNHARLQST